MVRGCEAMSRCGWGREIKRYLADHNAGPKTIHLAADPDTIIAAANQGYQTLDSRRQWQRILRKIPGLGRQAPGGHLGQEEMHA
jgi:hypothetical protein